LSSQIRVGGGSVPSQGYREGEEEAEEEKEKEEEEEEEEEKEEVSVFNTMPSLPRLSARLLA